jgi:hypothetical protein
MRQRILFASLLLLLARGNFAEGHGFSVTLVGNTIVATSGANTVNGLSDQLFVEEMLGSPTFYSASHGSVGSFSQANGFPAGSSLRIDFNGALWYSNGNGATPADLDTMMQPYVTFGSPLLSIDGASGPQTGFAVTGSSHSPTWSVLLKPAATLTEVPLGVYGWSYTISGSGPGGPFEPSLPLVVAFATDGFFGSQLEPAYLDVFHAAVPEPAACGLAAMGLGALFFARKRLRRKPA